MRSLLTVALLLLYGDFVYAQTSQAASSSISNSEQKYIDQINEVYGTNYPPADIRTELITLLRKRISFRLSPANPSKDFPLLSSLELRNKVNPSIQPLSAGNFDISTFNPLRYNFSFFEPQNYQTFRIDGTDFIMIVEPFTIAR